MSLERDSTGNSRSRERKIKKTSPHLYPLMAQENMIEPTLKYRKNGGALKNQATVKRFIYRQ